MMVPEKSFIMPAEWEEHEATWLAWPHSSAHWPEGLGDVERVYESLVKELSASERVSLAVPDAAVRDRISGRLDALGVDRSRVALHLLPTHDVWIRDYGPIFVRNGGGRIAALAWRFNAWGKKYRDLELDSAAAGEVGRMAGADIVTCDMVLEGGSVDVNGKGDCLTTEQCLLNPNRNPGLRRTDIEGRLRQFLGVRTVVWLKGGIAGDDTDGHVDDAARFVAPDTIVAAFEDDASDANHGVLKENHKRLKEARDSRGKPFRVVTLPMPELVPDGRSRLPASYANFYIGNGVVLVPIFNQPRDREALGILSKLFPRRRVVGVPCLELVKGMGAIHCVTQQQPKSERPKTEDQRQKTEGGKR